MNETIEIDESRRKEKENYYNHYDRRLYVACIKDQITSRVFLYFTRFDSIQFDSEVDKHFHILCSRNEVIL